MEGAATAETALDTGILAGSRVVVHSDSGGLKAGAWKRAAWALRGAGAAKHRGAGGGTASPCPRRPDREGVLAGRQAVEAAIFSVR
jgi:hypothetical protein